ncbi:MAG: ATP-dependent DNA helicase PcrA [Candidatus Pacebacteria bacterium CG10_big_fil_rev_8_21_14_0_10_56_10]|nr:MAG: ATP-dependent DNA helicase PcrA [Candidatus Pacebacteria bacterium CG10_big_fil_rev_8_21_14_0_10_56_10]
MRHAPNGTPNPLTGPALIRTMPDFFAQLNDQQRQAASHLQGPALVLAGAGSGKTRVLVTRAAWLLAEHQLEPERLMVVTFTNKAAAEINARLEELVGVRLPLSGTFHSLCARLLRRHGQLVGLSTGYSIFDSSDQLSLVKQLYKRHRFDQRDFKPQAVLGAISNAKNEMLGPAEYQQLAHGRFQEFTARLYGLYQRRLRQLDSVDFDDLLLLTIRLLESQPDVLARYQDQLSQVMVDEYQDTNKAQYQLTKLFAQPQNNLFVVGDFAQSIYTWRGADYRNMLNLQQDFADTVEYRLERNYRSSQTILDAATQVISQNTLHPVLDLWTDSRLTTPVTCLEVDTDQDEARLVIDTVRRELGQYDLGQVAILYRTNAQSRPFEEACVRYGLPYQVVGGFKFYDRREIKDLLAYLRLVLNPLDSVSQERALKLGKRRFAKFTQWQPSSRTTEPLDLLNTILELTDYRHKFDDQDPDDLSRLENIDELLNVASQFNDPVQFLENVALVQDNYVAGTKADRQPSLTLMSLHSAKGLEFPVVFLVGMEEGLLPHSRSLWDKLQMEEERRLCYVGITRAKERLFFSHARKRWQYGHAANAVRSRFLQDINPNLLQVRSQQTADRDNGWRRTGQSGRRLDGQTVGAGRPVANKESRRRLVVDEDSVDQLLSGELDIDTFIDS